jgi:hypothetical protein
MVQVAHLTMLVEPIWDCIATIQQTLAGKNNLN